MEVQKQGKLKFTVDSELLRELGERLIGAPHIALAELVKNSYDADAPRVVVDLDIAKERIVVEDWGNGMTFKEFEDFWMRVGSTHKVAGKRVSEQYGRLMTGSKGVGRLSVQYLAHEMALSTVSYKDLSARLDATVLWDDAVKTGDLTEATVDYDLGAASGQHQGTRIVLTKLKQPWGRKEVEGLAQEIWRLTPPFRSTRISSEDEKLRFDVEFRSQNPEFVAAFRKKMGAVLELWDARLTGRNNNGRVDLAVEFKGDPKVLALQYHLKDCEVRNGEYEVRVYKLKGRLPGGIPLEEARAYFRQFGGVHVYDGGFRLPFYGDPETDWLRVEFDHAHRLSMSKLLPPDYREVEGMNYLPTLSRLFGVVNIDTSREPDLILQVTRDRLQKNRALEQLRDIVRWSLDFYANEVARREARSKKKAEEITKPKAETLEEVLSKYKTKIEKETFESLTKEVRRVGSQYESAAEKEATKASTLGPLATAGISTLAAQHEIKREFAGFETIFEHLNQIRPANPKSAHLLAELSEELKELYDKLKATYALFSYFAEKDLTLRERRSARETIGSIAKQIEILTRGVPIHVDRVGEGLFLPKGTFAEWSSIFQNVMLNAYNAMLDSKRRVIDVSSREKGKLREILVQDTGCGVDVAKSEELFEPFVRKLELSDDMKALGYGGTGLGLTIVRLVAGNLGCKASFVRPEQGYRTAFSLRWTESK